MSLLLEALKRAEEDSRKRKASAASAAVVQPGAFDAAMSKPVESEGPSRSVSTLGDQASGGTPSRSEVSQGAPSFELSMAPIDDEPKPQIPTNSINDVKVKPIGSVHESATLEFPDLSLVVEESKAETAQATETPALVEASQVPVASQPQKPVSNPPAEAVAAEMANLNHVSPAEAISESSKPVVHPTARQAKAATRAMTGATVPKSKVGADRSSHRRVVWLGSFMLVVLLCFAGLFAFWDALMPTSSVLASGAPPGVASPQTPLVAAPQVTGSVSAADATMTASVAPAESKPAETPRQAPEVSNAQAAQAGEASKTVDAVLQPSIPPEVKKPLRNVRTAASKEGPGSVERRASPKIEKNDVLAPIAAAPEKATTNSVNLKRDTAKVTPELEAAYASYQAGETDKAEMLYRQAADADPMQRDAWLGLAVIAHGANRPLEAGEFYKRVLRLDPQNGTALAGVASLNRAAQAPAEESRLRELLATSPQSPTLNHALGLAMATQSRWAEAQDLFFKAHALDANNPRYAFNLAVSLDRLHKSALAAQFYQRAIDLAQGNTRTGVDVDVARARLRAISAALAESKP